MKRFYRKIALFFLLTVAVFALLFFVLPDETYSATEKRNLKQVPAFSTGALMDGSFMTAIEDYTADQFPLREGWMRLRVTAEELLGKKESQGVYRLTDGSLAERFDAPGAAEESRRRNALLSFAEKYKEKSNLTFLLVPTAVSGKADLLPEGAPTDDQDAYIDSLYAVLAEGGYTCLDVRDRFSKLRKTCAVYYNTDHHWTTDAAYAAYEMFAESAGIPVTAHTLYEATSSFTGSLAAKSGFAVSADTIRIGLPSGSEETPYTVTYPEKTVRTATCYDAEALVGEDPYQVFFGGNHPLITIQTGVEGDRSLLIIKDSYANAFVPFCISDYRTITVVDPRYYYDDLDALMGQGTTDVLFLYNVNTFAADTSLATVLENRR